MVTTMEVPIQKLSEAVHLCFSEEIGTTAFEDKLTTVASLVNAITCEDLNLDPLLLGDGRGPITYIPVCKHDVYSMSVFVVRAGSRVPLHNHPQMYGFCKVISGALHLKSYSRTEALPSTSSIQKVVSRACENSLEQVSLQEDRIVRSIDECCVLTPDVGNYHELISVEGTAIFFDILAPPYSRNTSRNCQYYEVLTDVGREEDESVHWLRVVPVPSYYTCDRCPYTGPPISSGGRQLGL